MTLSAVTPILDSFENGVIIVDHELNVHFWNRWLEIQTKVKSDEIVGSDLSTFFSEINANTLKRKIKTALTLKSPTFYTAATSNYLIKISLGSFSNTKYTFMQQNVSIYPLEENLALILIADQTEVLDKNHHLESSLQEVNYLNSALKHEQKIIDTFVPVVHTRDDKVVSISKAMCELDADTIGLYRFEDLFHEREDKVLESASKVYEFDHFYADDKELFYTVVSQEQLENDERVLILRDVTSELLVQEKQEQLIQQSQHAAMGEMISMIAHQWRQPLATVGSIVGQIHFSQSFGKLTEESLSEGLEKIETTVEFLSKTINDFSNFFKPNKERIEVDIVDVINQSLFFISHVVEGSSIKIENRCEEHQILSVYESELMQVFINLFKNAVDEHLKRVENDAYIGVKTSTDSDYYIISIYDNAGGIPKDIIQKVFQPYFSTKAHNGTGLGLYMSKTIVEEHHAGHLEVASSDGKTNFTLKLPLQSA